MNKKAIYHKQKGKRLDHKGRVLQKGESQRFDLSYQYRYTDKLGKRQYVYAPDLDELRRKEEVIQQQTMLGIHYAGGNITVAELVERYLGMLGGKRVSTMETYNFAFRSLRHESFGRNCIRDVKVSDCKLWCKHLAENVYKFGTIQLIKNVLRPAFQMAVDDDLLWKNPFDFRLSFIDNNAEKGFALSYELEDVLFDFMQGSEYYCKYVDQFRVLLGTGLRASELCGLTVKDLDFENRRIRIERQLKITRNGAFYIDAPKTVSGVRTIPMSGEVCDSLKRILANRKKLKVELCVDGHFGFLLLNQNDKPLLGRDLNRALRNMRKNYDANHTVPLPHIVPHTFRHTFCTRLLMNGMDLKSVQCLMGHADASTTLNVYSHINYDHVEAQFARVTVFRRPEAKAQ